MPKKRKVRPRMPPALRDLGEKAIARHNKRAVSPLVDFRIEDGYAPTPASPYAPRDQDAWEALLFEAFGTRSLPVMNYFLALLTEIVGQDWDADARKWNPSVPQMQTVISMVRSMKPADEAQAALCAQLCALHLSAMQLSKHTARQYSDARTLAVLNKTVRAYGDGLQTLRELQGKRRRRTTQVFRIEKHEHKHVHLPPGGSDIFGGQPCGARADAIEGVASVPSEQAERRAVPVPSGQGQARLPTPRRRKGQRGSEG